MDEKVRYVLGTEPEVRGGVDMGTARFDLGVPGLVAECIESLYRSTGVTTAPRDRVPYAAVAIGIIVGFGFGMHRNGMLYGPIGGALGIVFGAVVGLFVGVFLHFAASPWLRPEADLIRQVRRGNIQNAGRTLVRARLWIWSDRTPGERLGRIFLAPLGIGRTDLPPEIAEANISACEGILAESVGDVEAALNAYLRSLRKWPRHTFVLASAIELVMREAMWDRNAEVIETTKSYLERARDPRLIKVIGDYLGLLEKSVPGDEDVGPGDSPDADRVEESGTVYNRHRADPGGLGFRIVENPGSQISNGMLYIHSDGSEEEVEVKLAAMPFHLLLTLAESLPGPEPSSEDTQGAEWVSIQTLVDVLPWTTAHVTNTNVHKLVYKLRSLLQKEGLDRNIIEENQNGCYRLNIPPERVTIERAIKV